MGRLAVLGTVALLLPLALPAPAGAATVTISLQCDATPALEVTYSYPDCWNHTGHHTYFVGKDRSYFLQRVTGSVFSVEQQFSAPFEAFRPAVAAPCPCDADLLVGIPIETSMDGRSWSYVQFAGYEYVGTTRGLPCASGVAGWVVAPDPQALPCGMECGIFQPSPDLNDLPCADESDLTKQSISFDIRHVSGPLLEFRFLRVRQPWSAATEGLSGFLDFSDLAVTADEGPAVAAPDLVFRDGFLLGCEDILEDPDVFGRVLCSWGGVDKYDSPSFFFTWFLDQAQPSRIQASVVLLKWRPEQAVQFPTPTKPGYVDTELGAVVFLQVSPDGASWATVAARWVQYGDPGSLVSGPVLDACCLSGEVQFARLVSEKHALWDNPPNSGKFHHPKGYIGGGGLFLTGLVPADLPGLPTGET